MNWGVFGGGDSRLVRGLVPHQKYSIYVHIPSIGLTPAQQREYPQHVLLLFHAKALRLQSQGGVRSQE